MSIVIVGKSKKPYSEEIISSITKAVQSVPDIIEAYVPQWFEPDKMEEAEQVLVVILNNGKDPNVIMPMLLDAFDKYLPNGPDIPALPMDIDDPLLFDIKNADVMLDLGQRKIPWFKKLFK